MRRSARRLVLVASCLLVFLVARTSAAQDVPASFDQLQVVVKPGDIVRIVTPTGTMTTGKIAGLSPTTLSLDVKGTRRDFSQADVSRILQRRPDPLRNGALIGFAIGAGAFVIPVLMEEDDNIGAVTVFGAAMTGGLGALFGALADSIYRGRQVIYSRPSGTAASVRVAPIVSP